MQGILIASSNTAVQEALTAILQDGRTIQKSRTVAEALSMATTQRFDYVFVDDVFEDGNAEELIRRLHTLGYGVELIPVLLSTEQLYLNPFLPYGVKYAVSKPFNVEQIKEVINHIEELAELREIPLQSAHAPRVAPENVNSQTPRYPRDWTGGQDVDVREISQRLKRMISKLTDREDLIKAFADSMQEQFDVDNVVILLPCTSGPAFHVQVGNVPPEVMTQFQLPLDEPLVAALTRLGEPVWVHDREHLGRQNAINATRYGERLQIQVLCPVLSRGRLIALVGLSRFHRYEDSPVLISLLRLFLTFFSEALENTQMYERLSAAGETYRNMVDAAPQGALAVTDNGRIQHVNPRASELLGSNVADLVSQPVERAGSLIADAAWRAIRTGENIPERVIKMPDTELQISATLVNLDEQHTGVLIWLQKHIPKPAEDAETPKTTEAAADIPDWSNVARVIAHNFKNALVPVKTCAELLPERYQSEAFRQSFFNVVQENIGQLDGWIKELLRYAQTTEDPNTWETISLTECIQQAAEKTTHIHPEIRNVLKLELDDDIYVRGNRDSLVTATVELLKNAGDAVQDVDNPAVRVKTKTSDEKISVSISDNGPGLQDLNESAAVLPFTTNKLTGLGLGLAYVQRIIALHQGKVDFSSNAKGTTIKLSFPAPVKQTVESAQ